MTEVCKELPLVALTMGDVAGVGPEVIARAWLDPALHAMARPMVVGDPDILERATRLVVPGGDLGIQVIGAPDEASPSPRTIPCLPAWSGSDDLTAIRPGTVDRRAGRAAYDS